ncbi:MAG TPA: VOC family protein [Bryobacteraceae bacterium]|jgi:catechol 2,3-dioxygenase-like lactoylglutathione lyase family enzyme|nr:VOC family protein [Bryobacteraceae bacterium]
MEAIISNLLGRFERGGLSRRELVQGLAMLAASGGAASAQVSDAAVKAAKIDHVSIQVSDLPRAIAFYEKIFGLHVVGEDKPNEITRLGMTGARTLVSLHHKNPYAVVDHFAIAVEGFNRDAVTRELKARGVTPEENLDAGFHIRDPEGMNVQIVGV